MDSARKDYRDKYVFIAAWYIDVAEVEKDLLLSFYPHDETLELYDVKYRRMFLRRTHVNGVHLNSLFKGAVVTIFSRQIKIVDFANEATKLLFSVDLQKIFAVIKPDGVLKAGDIISYMENEGFKLTRLKMGRLTNDGVKVFCCKNQSPVNHDFVAAMTDGPSIAIEAIGEKGLQRWLKAVGPEDPEVARSEAPNSLRALHGGYSLFHNALHASSDPNDFSRESEVFFSPERDKLVEPSVLGSNTTCCIIKPHAVNEGVIGSILNFMKDNGFRITAMELFYLDQRTAEDFYEVYKGLVPEYAGMVTQLASGPCIVLEVIDDNNPSCTALRFREVAGPTDPASAKVVRPNSLRAKFGKTAVLNCIHCTDLPEDAELEVQYFFKIIQK